MWNPTLADLKKDGTVLVTSDELAEQGKLTADLSDGDQRRSPSKYPDAVQTWVDQQNKAVELYKSDPQAAGDGRRPPAQHHRRRGARPDEGPDLPRPPREQAGADYLGTPDAPGKLADNLESAAQFLKTQGSVQGVPPLTDLPGGPRQPVRRGAARPVTAADVDSRGGSVGAARRVRLRGSPGAPVRNASTCAT